MGNTNLLQEGALRPQLVQEPETGSWVQVIDATGCFAGFDPTDAQIYETVKAADAMGDPDFFRNVCANTRRAYAEMIDLAREEITGIDYVRLGRLRLPRYRRRSDEARQIAALISFGGMDSSRLAEPNTYEPEGET